MDSYAHKRSQKGLGHISGQILRGDGKWVGGYITAEGAWGHTRGGGDGNGKGLGHGSCLKHYYVDTDKLAVRAEGAPPGRGNGHGSHNMDNNIGLPFTPIEITIGWIHI